MQTVIRIDLRETATLDRLAASTTPTGLADFEGSYGLGSEGKNVVLPLRLLIIDPRGDTKTRVKIEVALARILQVDPPARAMILLNPTEGNASAILGDHTLPEIYSFPHVKVIEMRGDRLSSVHEGSTAEATEFPADARWA